MITTTRSMITTPRALAALVIGIALLGLVTVAPAEGAPTQATRSWEVVDESVDCPEVALDAGDGVQGPTITGTQHLCVAGEIDVATLPAQLRSVGTGRLAVVPGSFALSDLQVGSITVDVDRGTAGALAVTLIPDLRLEVRWDGATLEPISGGGTDATEDDGSADEVASSAGRVEVGDDSAAPGGLIPPQGSTKTITVTGLDAPDIAAAPDGIRFEVRETVPPNFEVFDLPRNTERSPGLLTMPLTGSSVRYRLSPPRLDAGGSLAGVQITELVVIDAAGGESVLARATAQIEAVGDATDAVVELAVEQSGFDAAERQTTITITVENTLAEPLQGPIDVTLTAQDVPAFVGYENPSEGGQPLGRTVFNWTLADGLPPGEQLVKKVEARLAPGDAATNVGWTVAVTQAREGTSVPLVLAEERELRTEVPALEVDGDEGEVNFTPGQLIRLIAFVIAFALMAIIFGAWSRTRRVDAHLVGEEAEAQRAHEHSVFKAFAESIIVLVIIVSILVLALEGSLQAESAASLIGVIAGYALGQRR